MEHDMEMGLVCRVHILFRVSASAQSAQWDQPEGSIHVFVRAAFVCGRNRTSKTSFRKQDPGRTRAQLLPRPQKYVQ